MSRLTVFLLAAAIVIVPTVMRSRQHVEMRDTTRLTIRLNLQSDAPPQVKLFVPDATTADTAPPVVVQLPHASRVTPRVHAYHEPIVQPTFDNAPDLFRGPPAPSLL